MELLVYEYTHCKDGDCTVLCGIIEEWQLYHIRTCMPTIHVYVATYNYNNILTSCSPWFCWISDWGKDSGFSWWHMWFWWLWADVGQWTEIYWGWFWQQLLWVWTDVSGCAIYSKGACRAWHLTPSYIILCKYSHCRWVHPLQQPILLLLCCCSLQFEGPNNYSPKRGVNIKVPGAAGTDISKVEYLDSFGLGWYANDLVDYFVARGYVRDFSIRAMPYDWRLAAGMCISMKIQTHTVGYGRVNRWVYYFPRA